MPSETQLRDQLAVDRTMLANERTLLAYVRTALTLIGVGAGLLEFSDAPLAHLWGWLLIAVGVLLLPIGVRRFVVTRRHLQSPDDAPRR